jgi:hypothetical protein
MAFIFPCLAVPTQRQNFPFLKNFLSQKNFLSARVSAGCNPQRVNQLG